MAKKCKRCEYVRVLVISFLITGILFYAYSNFTSFTWPQQWVLIGLWILALLITTVISKWVAGKGKR